MSTPKISLRGVSKSFGDKKVLDGIDLDVMPGTSMVVIGGLVGAGALGYDVVAGLSQHQIFGKGLAAGLTLVAMGIVIDRITQAAAQATTRRDVVPKPIRKPIIVH